MVNGQQWGGKSIWLFDSGRKLQKPGGQVRCLLNYTVKGTINVGALVDMHNVVREAQEWNNSFFAREVKCTGGGQGGKPDLVVRNISLTGRKPHIRVTLSNIGSAGVPSSYYDNPKSVAVQMYKGDKPWGGIILRGFDPKGKLQKPHSTVSWTWFPNADNLLLGPGKHLIKVVVDSNTALVEASETNNTLEKWLLVESKGRRPKAVEIMR